MSIENLALHEMNVRWHDRLHLIALLVATAIVLAAVVSAA